MKTKLILFLALLALCGSRVWADVTVTIGFTDGTYYQNSEKKTSYTSRPVSDTWSSYWESNDAPKVTLRGQSAWNLKNDTYYNTTYHLTVPVGYIITGYSITPSAFPNGSANLTPNGGSAEALSSGVAKSISGLATTATSFTLSDQVQVSSFTVTVKKAFVVSINTGDFYTNLTTKRGANDPNWGNKWVSSTASPQLTLIVNGATSTSGNNFKHVVNSDKMVLHNSTYNITISEGYMITGYSIIGTTSQNTLSITNNSYKAPTTNSLSAGVYTYLVEDLTTQRSSFIVKNTGSDDPYRLTCTMVVEYEELTSSASTLGIAKKYSIATNGRGSWYVGDEHDYLSTTSNVTNASSSPSTTTVDANSTNQQFAIVPHGGNYYLYSLSASKFLCKDNTLQSYYGDPITVYSIGGEDTYKYIIRFDDTHTINIGDQSMIKINDWGGTENGYFDEGNLCSITVQGDYDLTTAKGQLAPQDVTYHIISASGVEETNAVASDVEMGTSPTLPNVLCRGYCEYTFYKSFNNETGEVSDIITKLNNTDVYVKYNLVSCPITFSTEESPVWYIIEGRTNSSEQNEIAYANSTNVDASINPTVSSSTKWAFIGTPFAFKVKNGAGNYMVAGSKSGDQVTLDATGTNFGLFKNSAGGSNHIAIATYDGTNQNVLQDFNGAYHIVESWIGTGATFSNGTITGLSSAYFYPKSWSYASFAELYFANNAIGTKMALSVSNTIGYPKSTSTGYTELSQATSSAVWNETTYGTLQTKYNAFLTESNITMPKDGKVYKFTNVLQNNTTKQYVYDKDNSSKHDLTLSSSPISDGTEKFVCHVINEVNGEYAFVSTKGYYMVGATSSGGTEMNNTYNTNKQKCTIAKHSATGVSNDVAFGKVYVKFDERVNNTNKACLIAKDGGWGADQGEYVNGTWSTMFILEECDDYYNKVKLSSDGENAYASLYLPFSVTIPEGITAYAVESQNGIYAHMEPIVTNGTLPKETPAILKKNGLAANETVYLSPAEDAGSFDGTNILGGTATTTSRESLGTGSTYVLGNGGDGLGLYNYTGTYLAKGKAYLFLPGAGVRSLIFDFDFDDEDATAIANVNVNGNADKAAIYNIAGQRISKLQKGINIVNGKKVLY